MANKIYAHKTEVRRGDGGIGDAEEQFTAVAQIEGDIPFPELESDLIEVTTRDSPDNRREWDTGLEDSPEIQIEIFYDPEDDGHQALIEDQRTKARVNYQFAVLDANDADLDVWECEMLVRRFAPRSVSGGHYKAQVTFKPTGTLTQDVGSGDGDGDGGDG